MKNLFTVAILYCLLLSCNNNKFETNNTSDIQQTTLPSETKIDSFFPVTSFLKGQLHEIDSLPITPLRIVISGDKTDSFWIKREDLKTYLHPFIKDEIHETNLLSLFKETKFKDQSINAITFTYDPIKELPDSVAIQHWDVYINPETEKVTKVYIVKKKKDKKEEIIQQFTWLADKWAKIVTIKNNSSENKPLIKEEKFIWAFN